MKNPEIMFLLESCLLLSLSLGTVSCGTENGNSGNGGDADTGDLHKREALYLADPFIMLHDGVYYAYGTSQNPDGIIGYRSDDLQSWRKIEGKAKDGYVLHKDDVWGVAFFWAPEVYYDPGHDRFVMYYTAQNTTEPNANQPYICAAVSDSPLGPFTQTVEETMVSDRTLDNSLFVDDDGQKYMYFVIPGTGGNGNEIKVVKLQKDDITKIVRNTRVHVISPEGWERQEGIVTEGPVVVKHEGTYYMTYSGNSFRSHFYGVGCATSDSPMGTWTKYSHNPLLQAPVSIKGTGHNGLFYDKEGNLKVVFHAHYSDTKVLPRRMHITDAYFLEVDGKNVFMIDPVYRTPYLITENE